MERKTKASAAGLPRFFRFALEEATQGSRSYHVWMAFLTFVMCCGAFAYSVQLTEGLAATGMHDKVSWGFYISNFAFLVGIAAAAVILVLPTYVLDDIDFSRAVLIGEAVAVSALVMAIAFVVVDVGGPLRLWHLIPGIGVMNWPRSMLTWDILVLNVYLALNLSIPFYILYSHFQGREPVRRYYVPAVIASILWAVSLHLVTAFLFAGLPARPYWHNALLGPRFLATAFTAGPALLILILAAIRRFTGFPVGNPTINKLALVTTVSAQVTLVMLVSELFVEFYRQTHHSLGASYLFFGIGEHRALVPWIWTSIALNVAATLVLTIHPLRRRPLLLYAACAALFFGIQLEKGMGTIIPGFIPEPWGKIYEYSPTWVELMVSAGIWALGAFLFTVLAKVAIPIEMKRLKPGAPGTQNL
ncbi:MAG: sulfate reduction electron transfer complex DsrMKJOP subunit DsrP [Bryobacteraceae bacterium]